MRSSCRFVLTGMALALLLAGCGGGKNQKPSVDYSTPGVSKEARGSTLEVPPDLVSPGRDERYVVPDTGAARGSATLSGYQADRQPAAAAAAAGAPTAVAPVPGVESGALRIARAGGQRWLVVKGGNAQSLWPRLQDFWKDLGFVLVVDNPQAGLMETEWAQNNAKVLGDPVQDLLRRAMGTYYSTGERDKYRVRVETAGEPGAAEIYISHRGLIEVRNSGNQDGTHWEPRANDPALEGEMLQRLMVRLGTNEKVAEQAVADSVKALPERARLAAGTDGVLELSVEDGIDLAWRQIGLALDRTGVVVEDRDRAKNQYFVRYLASEDPYTQKERSGWFARLFSSKKESGTEQFRVLVRADGQKSVVRLLDKDGGRAPEASARQILTLLYNELK